MDVATGWELLANASCSPPPQWRKVEMPIERSSPSNENKMSDGGRERAPLAVEVWKSSQKWDVERSAVRSIAWLDADVAAE